MFLDEETHPPLPPVRRPPALGTRRTSPGGTWADVLKMTREQLTSGACAGPRRESALPCIGSTRTFGKSLKLPSTIIREGRRDHMMERDNADAFQFQKLLDADPALERAVWYKANSVQIRPPNSMRAIARLSQDDMWRLITQVGFERSLARPEAEALGRLVADSWRCDHEGCRSPRGKKAVRAYVAGLMHSIELSVYRAAVRVVEAQRRRTPSSFECATSSTPNSACSSQLAHGIDPPVVAAIGFHNSPNRLGVGKREAWIPWATSSLTTCDERMDTHGRMVIEKMSGVGRPRGGNGRRP